MQDIYVDVPRCKCISVYEVNSGHRVTTKKQFDLSRVAFCTGGVHPAYDHCLLAWLYRQETPIGFQLDCHVIRLSTRMKARRLAAHIGASFDRAFADVNAAVEIGCQLALTCRNATSQNTGNTCACCLNDGREQFKNINICATNTVSRYRPLANMPTSGETLSTSVHPSCSESLDDDVFMANNEH